MTGQAGTIVEVIYSQEFVAGVDETGTTQVQVFVTDTVQQALPLDTIVAIPEARFFVQIRPTSVEQANVDVEIRVDDRSILEDNGNIFAANPWRWVYLYNHQLTRVVNVVF